MSAPSQETAFWSKVNRYGPVSDFRPDLGRCWLWTGANAPTKSGYYGRFWNGIMNQGAHRFAYELLKGPIPDGLQLDHLCRVTLCVNPDHLEPVTNRENSRRGGELRRQSHCRRGHPLSSSNIYPSGSGGRQCRQCALERAAFHRSRARRGSCADCHASIAVTSKRCRSCSAKRMTSVRSTR